MIPKLTRSRFCVILATCLVAAGLVLWFAGRDVAPPKHAGAVTQARDNLAMQTGALWQSHAALGQLIVSMMPLLGGIEKSAPLLTELAHAHPNVWDIAVYDASGQIVFETRKADPDSLTISGRALSAVEAASAAADQAPMRALQSRLVHTAESPIRTALIGVATDIGGPEAGPHGSVVVLMLSADLPEIGPPLGRNWLLGPDGDVLVGAGDWPGSSAAKVIDQNWPALRDRQAPVGMVSVNMPDGLHQLLYRRLDPWPVTLVIDLPLTIPRPGNPFAFATLGLAAAALLSAWLMRPSRHVPSQRLASAQLVPHGAPAVPRDAAAKHLAACVAHEINNVLTVLSVDAELVVAVQPGQPDLEVLGKSMLEAAGRGATLTHSLLCFAERAILRPERIDLRSCLSMWQTSLAASLDPGQSLICIDTTPAGQRAEVMADLDALEIGLSKLLRNAAEASGPAAQISLELQSYDTPDGPMVAIVVDDTGVGMDEASALAALDPGFSAKRDRRHLGLGLSAAAGFARQSGGGLTLDSRPGVGTRVSLSLPLLSDLAAPKALVAGAESVSPAARPPRALLPAPTGSAARVLLVEDNPLVRDSIARRLRADGYQVIEAQLAADVQAHVAHGVDVLVTDIMLDEATDGWTLAAQARAINPRLPLVFMSGFMSSRQPELLAGDELASFLRKPVNGAELHTVIEGLLALLEMRSLQNGEAG